MEGRHRGGLHALIVIALAAAAAVPAQGATFLVANTDDDGSGSLRRAIEDANADAVGAPHTIDATGVSGSIDLASTLPVLFVDAEILGPGASSLTVNGADTHRVFSVGFGVVATISGLTIADGSAAVGAGVLNLGTLTLTGVTLTGNAAAEHGGAIANGGTLTVTSSTLTGNSAVEQGGGIANEGTLSVVDSTLAGNMAELGGGIFNDATVLLGTVAITNSTLEGNSADFGGGIFNVGAATITNSTLSGNSASASGGGVVNNGMLTMSFSTLAGNSAEAGGGIHNVFSGIAIVKNSIVADSPDGGDCLLVPPSTWTALGENFDTDGTCDDFNHVSTADLALGLLQDNGGPTETHALGAASFALDAALDCTDAADVTVSTDQRGEPRPSGAACDAGAFELQVGSPPSVLEIPTVGTWGLLALALLLAAAALSRQRRWS